MSWETMANTFLMTRGLASAAILGHDGNLFTASQSFSYKSEEIEVMLQRFEDPTDIMANGLSLGGTQYWIIKFDGAETLGKAGTKGVCIRKTTKTFIIGICDEPMMDLANCKKLVEDLADYLISVHH